MRGLLARTCGDGGRTAPRRRTSRIIAAAVADQSGPPTILYSSGGAELGRPLNSRKGTLVASWRRPSVHRPDQSPRADHHCHFLFGGTAMDPWFVSTTRTLPAGSRQEVEWLLSGWATEEDAKAFGSSRLLKKSLRVVKTVGRRGIFRLEGFHPKEMASVWNHFHLLFTPPGTRRPSEPEAWAGEQGCRRRR